MLYHLLASNINLFRYITFRGIGAFITAFILAVWLGAPLIERLRVLKFGQVVRDDGPQTHKVKTGTPTMGGFFLWGAALVSAALWCAFNIFVLIAVLSVVLYALIGFIDDYAKIKKSNTKGLSSWGKIFWQSLSALALLLIMLNSPSYNTTISRMDLAVRSEKSGISTLTNVAINQDFTWNLLIPPSPEKDTLSFSLGVYAAEAGSIRYTNAFSFPAYLGEGGDYQTFKGIVSNDTGDSLTLKLTRTEHGAAGEVLRAQETNFIVPYRSQLFQAQFLPYYAKVLWLAPVWLMILFYIFLIVGFSNATNLSDGLDGLATGMGIAFFLPFGIFSYLMGNILTANYLLLPYIQGIGELSVFVAAVLGGLGGFLWYNVHPAQVFMGDTGSLPMGACAAVIAIMLKQELLLPIAGFMFVLETVSVILQVGSFKLRKGKRIFKMAPIHHHFEQIGWAENQVVVRFWILGVFFALLAIASLKIR